MTQDIKCPNCGARIPNDSNYCDQCGSELLVCLKCGNLGTDAFCDDCGGPMVARKNAPSPQTSQTSQTSDDIFKTGASALRLKLRDGRLILTVKDGALIGRTEGEYASQLASYDLISRRHATFSKQGRQWMLTDLGSTNGCYINDVECKPNQPMPFKKGDVVDIATYIFDVI